MKRQEKKAKTLYIMDEQMAAIRMQAVEVAARLPEGYPGGLMQGGSPGKSADKVVADAEKILAFVTKRA